MAIMTIEYDEKNKYARQVLTGLLGAGIIHRKDDAEYDEIHSLKTALWETKLMSADIVQNGVEGYKTLDDLLNDE